MRTFFTAMLALAALGCGSPAIAQIGPDTPPLAVAVTYEPNMRLVHPSGAIRIQSVRITQSHVNQGSTHTPLPGDVLVVVAFAPDAPGTAMQSPAGAIGVEDSEGNSVITPTHNVAVGSGGLTGTAKSPLRYAVDTFTVGPDGSSTGGSRIWVLIWSVKADALPVYLRVPGVSNRIKLPEA